MLVREGQELVPVEPCDLMLARADVVSDGVQDGSIEWRHLIRAQVLFPQQAIDRAGGNAGEKLPLRVSPSIFFCAGDIHRARRDQCNQLVHIDWKLINMIGILLKVFREPVRKASDQARDGLAVVAASERGPTLARTARY